VTSGDLREQVGIELARRIDHVVPRPAPSATAV
jgi:hypothetical protein